MIDIEYVAKILIGILFNLLWPGLWLLGDMLQTMMEDKINVEPNWKDVPQLGPEDW